MDRLRLELGRGHRVLPSGLERLQYSRRFAGGPGPGGVLSISRRRCVGPLLTERVHTALRVAFAAGERSLECSLDLGRSRVVVEFDETGFVAEGSRYPWLEDCRDRTVYHWSGAGFAPVARFSGSLVKLVPTEWGPPTFEIDGIKMLPTSQVSPWEDARDKVRLVRPAGRCVLDTCGGLGYFAAWCLASGALEVRSFERSADVLWLRSLNPWSPGPDPRLHLEQADVSQTDPRPAGRWLRGRAARSAALRHRRGSVLSGLLRPARSRAHARRTPVSLHGSPEQAQQRPRPASGGRQASASGPGSTRSPWATACLACDGVERDQRDGRRKGDRRDDGSDTWIRTRDPLINSQLLYR